MRRKTKQRKVVMLTKGSRVSQDEGKSHGRVALGMDARVWRLAYSAGAVATGDWQRKWREVRVQEIAAVLCRGGSMLVGNGAPRRDEPGPRSGDLAARR